MLTPIPNYDNAYIVKPRGLINAIYDLKLSQLRLVLACFAQMDTRNQVSDTYFIRAADYMKIYGLKSGNAYTELRKAAEDLWDEEIVMHPGESIELKRRWIISVDYYHGEGYVRIQFHPEIIPHFGELKGHFSKYRYKNVWQLNSQHGLRLYEMMIENENIGVRKIEVEWLREELKLGNKYKQWSDFYKRVIAGPVDAINKSTNVNIHTIEKIKMGKSVRVLKFYFEVGEDMSFDMLDSPQDRQLKLELRDKEPEHPFREESKEAHQKALQARDEMKAIMQSVYKR